MNLIDPALAMLFLFSFSLIYDRSFFFFFFFFCAPCPVGLFSGVYRQSTMTTKARSAVSLGLNAVYHVPPSSRDASFCLPFLASVARVLINIDLLVGTLLYFWALFGPHSLGFLTSFWTPRINISPEFPCCLKKHCQPTGFSFVYSIYSSRLAESHV